MADVKSKTTTITSKETTAKAAPVAAVAEKKTVTPAEEKKETAKKAAETEKKVAKKPGRKPGKKAAAKTEKKKERVQEIYFEYSENQIVCSEIISKIEEAFKAEGHRVSTIKDLRVYVNINENRAYYIINDKAEGKFVEL